MWTEKGTAWFFKKLRKVNKQLVPPDTGNTHHVQELQPDSPYAIDGKPLFPGVDLSH